MPNPHPRCGDGAQSPVACPDSEAFSSNFSNVVTTVRLEAGYETAIAQGR